MTRFFDCTKMRSSFDQDDLLIEKSGKFQFEIDKEFTHLGTLTLLNKNDQINQINISKHKVF